MNTTTFNAATPSTQLVCYPVTPPAIYRIHIILAPSTTRRGFRYPLFNIFPLPIRLTIISLLSPAAHEAINVEGVTGEGVDAGMSRYPNGIFLSF